MNAADKFDVVVLGSGTGGKWMARTMAQEGMRTAVVERRYIGGSCVNIACLPSKNVIHTAKVASLARRHQEFGIQTGLTAVNMSGVYARKRKMVDEIVQVHLDRYEAVGDELILVGLGAHQALAIAGGEGRCSKAGNSTVLSRTRGSLRIPKKAVNGKRTRPGHYQGC